jgi:hypothetical protein
MTILRWLRFIVVRGLGLGLSESSAANTQMDSPAFMRRAFTPALRKAGITGV